MFKPRWKKIQSIRKDMPWRSIFVAVSRCHSCSVACKAENRVPLGVFRSCVKLLRRESIQTSLAIFFLLSATNAITLPVLSIAQFKRPGGRRMGLSSSMNIDVLGVNIVLPLVPIMQDLLTPLFLSSRSVTFAITGSMQDWSLPV